MLFMMRYLSFATFAALLLGTAWAAPLNDTGIDFCGDAVEGNAPCHEMHPAGQDALHGRDAKAAAGKLTKIGAGSKGFDFTKIANDGRELPASAALGSKPGDWACTRDNVTKLLWEVKTSDSGLRDQNWTYSWYDLSAPGGNPGTASGGTCASTGRCDTDKYIKDINRIGLCGGGEWRMPSVKELFGIVDHSIPSPGPTIDTKFFSNTPSSDFWSGSPTAADADGAWAVHFYDGYTDPYYRNTAIQVRLVRGGQTSEIFVGNQDGTVSQTNTGLMWAQCSAGQTGSGCVGNATEMTWASMLASARASRLGGYADWRLPNVKELQALVDYARSGVMIDATVFPNTPDTWFWSGSPNVDMPDDAWLVNFSYGRGALNAERSGNHPARLVRDGQSSNAFVLTVAKTGNGSVTSAPAGIKCGKDCTKSYPSGTAVTLTAIPASGFGFGGWGGDYYCDSTGDIPSDVCTTHMDQDRNVSARFFEFEPTLFTLSVSAIGKGTVTIRPPDIVCGSGSVCVNNFENQTPVTLIASPASGYRFSGWSGACSGTTVACTVKMTTGRNVSATFVAISAETYSLTVTKNGTGVGTITSTPAGINCGGNCSKSYARGTTVTLTATASKGTTFSGWRGACSGTGTCIVTMNAAQNVTATFDSGPTVTYPLTVKKGGTGSGTVASIPGGINCGDDCRKSYARGASVTLTAAPASGSVFMGWRGACTGTYSTCAVTMDAAQSVAAIFNITYPLNVTKRGSGTVTSTPAGINCGKDCSAPYTSGKKVTLRARATSSSIFTGWSGACESKALTCVVTLDAAKSVTATFAPTSLLRVDLGGTGEGTVTSAPAGINCGKNGVECTKRYLNGQTVTLIARPVSGSIFNGWSRECRPITGKPLQCKLTLKADTNVEAKFIPSKASNPPEQPLPAD